MSNLILRQADDKTYHLFWWDLKTKEIQKIAKGKLCRQLDAYGYSYLLGNKDGDCQVYVQRNSELEIISVCSQNVELVESVCTYERDGQWYCFTGGRVVLLGRRYEQAVSLACSVRLEKTKLYYFVLGDATKDFVLSFIYGNTLIQGDYSCGLIKNKEDYILARRSDGCYDIYSPEGLYVYCEGDRVLKRYFLDKTKRIYFWDEKVSAWRMISPGGYVWAENALIIDYAAVSGHKAYSILFEVKGTSLTEKARGRFKAYRDGSYSFDGLIFSKDYWMDRVDFEKTRNSFWRKVKLFFLR